jgi:lysophospholipid acyltransferase (LPLAT)-like uncharacterized protein
MINQPMERHLETSSSASVKMAPPYSFASLAKYPFTRRLVIHAADLAFYLLINTIGHTVTFAVEGWENWEKASRDGAIPIYTIWHNRVFLSTYFFRHRGIVVMTSQSFDGEYIARFIQRFGYGAARGSSTRGATGALVEMIRSMNAGRPAGFTIDGPRGPKYVAKMGAIMLAKKTGHPILPFTVTTRRYWEANSWDRFQVPWPFTKALVLIAPPILVSADTDETGLAEKRDELQHSLDELNRRGEDWRTR